MITQFQGEDRKQAIINHFSLDIEEEDLFIEYIEDMGYNIHTQDELLEHLHAMWIQERYKD